MCNKKHDLICFQKNEGKKKRVGVVGGGREENFWRLFEAGMFPNGKTKIRFRTKRGGCVVL